MRVDVELLVPYNQIAKKGHLQIEMEGDTLAELLEHLVKMIPALANHFTGEEFQGTWPFLLMINGEIVPGGQAEQIKIRPGDRVTFTQILAGG